MNSNITILIISILFALGAIVLAAIIWRNIFSKAGYPGWYWIFMFIPLANFAALLYLAFSKWPILKEKENDQVNLQQLTGVI